mmetsp:Transcript_27669/g.86061  ORF Transcript_27669/g.86061 Transcript_27669/m.86061 type:complete len:284 (-) Transcript_27669:369-1220(-)
MLRRHLKTLPAQIPLAATGADVNRCIGNAFEGSPPKVEVPEPDVPKQGTAFCTLPCATEQPLLRVIRTILVSIKRGLAEDCNVGWEDIFGGGGELLGTTAERIMVLDKSSLREASGEQVGNRCKGARMLLPHDVLTAPKPPAPFSWLSARSTGPGPLGGGRREGRLSRRALRCASCCARSSPMHRSCSSHSSRALSMARRWMACLRRRCSAAGAADGGASAESVPLTPRRTASAFGASLCSRGPEPCSSNLSWMALRFAASSPTHLFKSSTRARSRCRASSSA